MKTIIPIILLALVCGCSNKVTEQRIANLEQLRQDADQRIGQLEVSNQQLREDIVRNQKYFEDLSALMNKTIPVLQNMQAGMTQLLALTNSPVPTVQKVARALAPTKATGGIPADVYQTIRAEAARRYPKDWDMQEYLVGQQVEAYRKLNP